VGFFDKIKKVAKKAQKTVRRTVEKATAKTPIAAQVKTLTRASVKDPASLMRAAKTVGTAYAAYASGGLSVIAKKAVTSAMSGAKKSADNLMKEATKSAFGGGAPVTKTAKGAATAVKKTPLSAKAPVNKQSSGSVVRAAVPMATPDLGGARKGDMTRDEWKIYASQKKTVGGLL
jgi:hypothetical protein